MSLLVADTSLWHRRAHPAVRERWASELLADNVGITPFVRLEVLYSARSEREYADIGDELDGLRPIPSPGAACDRALEVQRLLAARGAMLHRSVGIPDLLIAAATELAGGVVWHYDEDYDRIAAVTGQPTAWVVPRGSV